MPRSLSARIWSALRELTQREPLFHRPDFGRTRAAFAGMTDPTFWEVGASGRRYDRGRVLAEVTKRYRDPRYRGVDGPPENRWRMREFRCVEIARDSFLFTYVLIQGKRVTRRATIWRRSGRGWKALYHQGTVIKSARPPSRVLNPLRAAAARRTRQAARNTK